MINFFDRPPRMYHKKLQSSFDWVVGDTIKVKKILVKSGGTIEEIIEHDYPDYELEALAYVGKKDNKGKDLIEGDEICYGERQDCYGTIAWSNYWLTWVIIPKPNQEGKYNLLSDKLRDYESKYIHFISHKHGELE